MTYASVIAKLGLQQVCLGDFIHEPGTHHGCGLSERAHRGIIDPFDVIHWRERRMTRRGLRRFLLLVARRDRVMPSNADPSAPTRGFLNDGSMLAFHLHWEEQYANMLASFLGVRFPAELSKHERERAAKALAGRTRQWPAVTAWAANR